MFTVVLKEDSHKEKLSNYFCFSSSSYISIYQYYTYSYEGLNKIEKKSLYEVILGKRRECYEGFLIIFVRKFGSCIQVSKMFDTTHRSSFFVNIFIKNQIDGHRKIEQCLRKF
jgi:hypothetical protein